MRFPTKEELATWTEADIKVFVEKWSSSRENTTILTDHLEASLKARTLTVSGDTGHHSIGYYINRMFANIDAPPKYDFQSKTHAEDEFWRVIDRSIQGILRIDTVLSDEELAGVIAGTAEATFRGGTFEGACYDCGAAIHITVRGTNVHFHCDRECEGNRYYTVDIDFPTGEVVFADWPDRFPEMQTAKLFSTGSFNINYRSGERKSVEEMAKSNILHMFVGNSCPGLHYNPETAAIHIGSTVDFDEDTDEETPLSQFAGFERLGGFCTDLWWVTMVDKAQYEGYLTQLGESDAAEWAKDVETAKVRPGRYRFKACYGMDDSLEDPHDTNTYVTAEYLGPCV